MQADKTKGGEEVEKETRERIPTIIDLGGHLISDRNGSELDDKFLSQFHEFFDKQSKRKFIFVVGGGQPARDFQNACRRITPLVSDNGLDWLGIQLTRANAWLVALTLGVESILDHEPNSEEIRAFLESNKKFLVVSGWSPNQTTDGIAARCAQLFGASEIIVASNTSFVCREDPQINPLAEKIQFLDWNEYLRLIPHEHKPGESVPFDIVAANLAMELGFIVKMIIGNDWENFSNALNGLPFVGTTISPACSA